MSATEKLTPFLWRRPIPEEHGGGWQYGHWCRPCGHMHSYRIGSSNRPSWTFDGNIERPSFQPSMLEYMPAIGANPQRTLCHFYVTNGQIIYQPDCPHEFAGQTLELEPIPEKYGF